MSKDQTTEEQTVFTGENQKASKGGMALDKSSTGLQPNLAGLLCYLFVFGLIASIIFLVMEKESKFVKYHALQSIFLTVSLIILYTVLTFIPILGWLMIILLAPVSFVLWLFLMYKAYQGDTVKLPIIGDMAMQQVAK